MRAVIILLSLYISIGTIAVSDVDCYASSKEISACGRGTIIKDNTARARNIAVQDAMRNAIEMGLGSLLDSQTLVQNDELIRDRIYTQSSGYLREYIIVSEGPVQDGNAYEVCLKAKVQLASIENDLRALGVLRNRIGDLRFMSLYVPRRDSSLPGNSAAVAAAREAVNETFIAKGFRVLEEDLSRAVQIDIERPSGVSNLRSISSRAFKSAADLLLVLDVGAVRRTELSNQRFAEFSFDVRLQAVAPQTADIISSSGDYVQVRTLRAALDEAVQNPMAEEQVKQLATQVAGTVLSDTVSYFGRQVHEGSRYSCLFTNFDQNERFTIVEVIENLTGFKGMDVRNESFKAFEVDIRFLGKKIEFQRELNEALTQKGIHGKFPETSGNTLRLIKSGK